MKKKTCGEKRGQIKPAFFLMQQGILYGCRIMLISKNLLLDGLKTFLVQKELDVQNDSLAVLPNSSGLKIKSLKKNLAFFKSIGLQVTIESPMMTTDYLDVKLNLNDLSYKPYKNQNA